MTAHVAHFVVTGEFLTETARRLWAEEDEPERALRILECLRDGKDGISEADCLAVLEGRMKLVGDSSRGIELKPDRVRGKKARDVIAKLKAERDEARDERADLQQLVIGDEATEVLASPTGLRRVPARKTEQRTIKGSRRTVLKEDYEFDDVLADPETPAVRGRGTKPLRVWQQVSPMPTGSRGRVKEAQPEEATAEGDEDREARERREEAEERERARKALPVADRITGDTGWLSPDGKFYGCGYSQHARTAWALGLTDNPQNHWASPAGWIRLTTNGPEQLFFPDDADAFTPVQRDVIQAYCQELKIELPWWLRKEES